MPRGGAARDEHLPAGGALAAPPIARAMGAAAGAVHSLPCRDLATCRVGTLGPPGDLLPRRPQTPDDGRADALRPLLLPTLAVCGCDVRSAYARLDLGRLLRALGSTQLGTWGRGCPPPRALVWRGGPPLGGVHQPRDLAPGLGLGQGGPGSFLCWHRADDGRGASTAWAHGGPGAAVPLPCGRAAGCLPP